MVVGFRNVREAQDWLRPFADHLSGDLGPVLRVLLGAVAFVLLIACANVASLQLVRTAGRAREIAVRVALGARRRSVVRQQLIESLLYAAFGGLAGLALGWAALRLLARWDGAEYRILRDVRLDGPRPVLRGAPARPGPLARPVRHRDRRAG